MSINTILPWGVDGKIISVEIDSSRSLPGIDIIGLPDSAVRESKERLRSAFRACNIDIPPYRYIINLSPSDIKKSGALFDVPIAVALLYHIIDNKKIPKEQLGKSIFIGELGLDGQVKGIRGVLSIIITAKKMGYTHVFLPYKNKSEIYNIEGITICLIAHIEDIVKYMYTGVITQYIPPTISYNSDKDLYDISFDDIVGQESAKHAMAVGAAGLHNVLMIGAPGTGKSMLAKAIPSILPPLSSNELIEVNQIYSLSGRGGGYITRRPFRSIHHTASKIAIVGGGPYMTPGELSHAHRGVLFLDELPEFPRDVLDILRQPLEDKYITISRIQGSITFPAHCMVIGAMNPCICGYYKDTEKICTCALQSIKRYQGKLSGPLLDRFDITVEVNRESGLLHKSQDKMSGYRKDRVYEARERQQKRYSDNGICSNSQLSARDIKTYIILDPDCEEIVMLAEKKLTLSHRAIHKMLKITRTIADIDGSDTIKKEHLLEALQYRSKQMFINQ